MELLLLLTAFFASLTGVGAGEGGVRQVQGVAVVRAAERAQAAVLPARRALPAAIAAAAFRPDANLPLVRDFAALVAQRLPFERRLE
ncbi:hypothetical protein [Sphingomonas hengshuiensis]|uniref:Uncharacterized protein n=1 Tax=Sphingomonas hengshuiensis TaxID=1609977 RepID=A0A7U4J7T6_9SPHN|nr:hypothetical protein [Sphingomonas hengshuiensis]AJP71846.1 hypothetical protein TS85_08720 [Sphingomonas hengshuiensis]